MFFAISLLSAHPQVPHLVAIQQAQCSYFTLELAAHWLSRPLFPWPRCFADFFFFFSLCNFLIKSFDVSSGVGLGEVYLPFLPTSRSVLQAPRQTQKEHSFETKYSKHQRPEIPALPLLCDLGPATLLLWFSVFSLNNEAHSVG